jgi:hypothetical protein
VRHSKVGTKKGENLVLEPLQSSSLFGEVPTAVPPIQAVSYDEGAIEETLEEFEFEGEEAVAAGVKEKEEAQAEQALQEDHFHPQDITGISKGLEKISLLTFEGSGVGKVKEGERQVKIRDQDKSTKGTAGVMVD